MFDYLQNIGVKNLVGVPDSTMKYFIDQGLKKNKHHFDMRKLLNFQLLKSSVHKVCNVMIDTYLDENLFFSHRKSFQSNTLPTGRMINIIGFKNND